MRHLLNTYIQADPAADLGNLNSLSLTELIIETGIHDAIARKLNEKRKLSQNAIAEGIINNVRKRAYQRLAPDRESDTALVSHEWSLSDIGRGFLNFISRPYNA